MNKQQLIESLNSSRRTIGYSGDYNMSTRIGPYKLSVSVGDGMYCSPREGGFEPAEYTTVEAAIIGTDGDLMSVKQIHSKFGTDCAKLCESYGLGDDDDYSSWADMQTVMPYITWAQVVFVANMIELHSPSASDIAGFQKNEWNDETCEPF